MNRSDPVQELDTADGPLRARTARRRPSPRRRILWLARLPALVSGALLLVYALLLPGLFLTRVRHVNPISLVLALLFAAILALVGALLLRAARAAATDSFARWVSALLSLGLLTLGVADLDRPRGALGLAAAFFLTLLGLVGAISSSVVLLSRDPDRD